MDASPTNGGGLSGGLMGGMGLSTSQPEDQKFSIIQADVSVSGKTSTKSQRPCQSYIDIEFRKEIETTYFNYLIF